MLYFTHWQIASFIALVEAEITLLANRDPAIRFLQKKKSKMQIVVYTNIFVYCEMSCMCIFMNNMISLSIFGYHRASYDSRRVR